MPSIFLDGRNSKEFEPSGPAIDSKHQEKENVGECEEKGMLVEDQRMKKSQPEEETQAEGC